MAADVLREIRLYGRLGETYGRVHRFAVRSVAEAVQALCANFPSFESDLVGSDPRNTRYKVWSGARRLGEKELQMGGGGVIRIAPVLAGAKEAGVFQTILGVVLVVVGAVLVYTGYGAPVGQYLMQVGGALILGGVIQMLMPTPKADKARDQPTSNFFDGPAQTTAQGNAVPLLYGELFVGSAVISAGISVEQIMTGPSAPATGGGRRRIPAP